MLIVAHRHLPSVRRAGRVGDADGLPTSVDVADSVPDLPVAEAEAGRVVPGDPPPRMGVRTTPGADRLTSFLEASRESQHDDAAVHRQVESRPDDDVRVVPGDLAENRNGLVALHGGLVALQEVDAEAHLDVGPVRTIDGVGTTLAVLVTSEVEGARHRDRDVGLPAEGPQLQAVVVIRHRPLVEVDRRDDLASRVTEREVVGAGGRETDGGSDQGQGREQREHQLLHLLHDRYSSSEGWWFGSAD